MGIADKFEKSKVNKSQPIIDDPIKPDLESVIEIEEPDDYGERLKLKKQHLADMIDKMNVVFKGEKLSDWKLFAYFYNSTAISIKQHKSTNVAFIKSPTSFTFYSRKLENLFKNNEDLKDILVFKD